MVATHGRDSRALERLPRILISCAEAVQSERWEDYADGVRRAGGEPVALGLDTWRADQPLPPHDGVLLTGGVDIDPARYGAARSPQVLAVNPQRDAFELALIASATERGSPLFGICRGHQLLNVARGGSLLQHIEQREPHRSRRAVDGTVASGWHDVELAPGMLLASVLGARPLRVNSRHHQAVTAERVAPGLVVAATAPDGIVEALVDPAQPWALSVQWHPERAELAEASRPLFDAFVAAAAAFAAGELVGGRPG